MHVGIDVRMIIINWFSCAFKEPIPPVHMFNPKWFLPEGAKRVYHFGSRTDDCIVNQFVLDSAYAEPSDTDHPDVMMAFSLEFEE